MKKQFAVGSMIVLMGLAILVMHRVERSEHPGVKETIFTPKRPQPV